MNSNSCTHAGFAYMSLRPTTWVEKKLNSGFAYLRSGRNLHEDAQQWKEVLVGGPESVHVGCKWAVLLGTRDVHYLLLFNYLVDLCSAFSTFFFFGAILSLFFFFPVKSFLYAFFSLNCKKHVIKDKGLKKNPTDRSQRGTKKTTAKQQRREREWEKQNKR